MFSKFFQLFSLKRKFFSAEETDTSVDESSSRPTKRVRIEEPSEDQPEQFLPVQDARATDDDEEEEELEVCDEILPRGTKGKEVERIAALEEEVRETRAIAARLQEETRNYVDSIDRAMNCVVCYDFIRNPQVLSECGHTVCYPCLRSWFTRDREDDLNDGPMVSTDEESDGGDDDGKQSGSSKATPPPRRRHRFHSAVNRKKVCPECSAVITRRPLPLFRLRLLAEVINGAESPVPSIIQPRPRLHQVSRRQDLWHGIFHAPEGQPAPMPQGRNGRDAGLVQFDWTVAIEHARRQLMQRERSQPNEERRPQPFFPSTCSPDDEPTRVVERRIRALPSRRTLPTPPPVAPPSSSSTPRIFMPAASPFPQRPPSPSAWRDMFQFTPPHINSTQANEFVTGPDALPSRPSHSVSLGPPPSEAGPSNSNPSSTYSHTSPPSNQHSSAPAIPDRQFERPPSPHHSERGEHRDQDLPPLTAMIQAPNPPPAPPQYQREYPVYVEELVLGEDLPQPQAMEVDMPVTVHLDEDQGLPVPPVQEAEENFFERMGRAIMEGRQYEREEEEEGGVDLE